MIGDPDDQSPDKWSSTVLVSLCLLTNTLHVVHSFAQLLRLTIYGRMLNL